jgi:hypothetical protein
VILCSGVGQPVHKQAAPKSAASQKSAEGPGKESRQESSPSKGRDDEGREKEKEDIKANVGSEYLLRAPSASETSCTSYGSRHLASCRSGQGRWAVAPSFHLVANGRLRNSSHALLQTYVSFLGERTLRGSFELSVSNRGAAKGKLPMLLISGLRA